VSPGAATPAAARLLCGAALLCLLAQAAGAAHKNKPGPHPGSLPPIEVQDLYYGDVLFHLYSGDDFGALVRLKAAMEQNRIQHHFADAELVLGGLYLQDGQHAAAGEVFSRVLDRKDVPPGVRDRARFYLGKVWYQRGYYERAAETLGDAGSHSLPPGMDAERRMLQAQSLLALGRYQDAIAALDNWQGPPDWQVYARYNLGVALVRSQQLDAGTQALNAVGTVESSSPEIIGLRDKANLALGYAYLQAKQPDRARAVLERVRIEGPLSTKALLGVGWADANDGQYKAALTPWMELHGRNLLDAAVQESYLAVPYAYARLGADGQAVEYYEGAVHEFSTEADRIDESIAAIRSGKLLDTIVKHEGGSDLGWSWQLTNLPDAPESRYLYHLLAGNEFQEGLKNYRQLLHLERNLDQWQDSIGAFDNMLATRRARYDATMPMVNERLKNVDLDDMRRQLTEIESKLSAAEASGDAVALGTDREREVYLKVQKLEALAASSSGPDAADAREKLRLIKGVEYWQMHAGFKARAWSVHKNLRETQQALRETQGAWTRVQEAKHNEPDHNGEIGKRIDDYASRIVGAEAKVASLKESQTRYLADLAIQELESQKERLATYTVQARYELATIYDRASAAPAPSGPPAENQGPIPAPQAQSAAGPGGAQ
jgi:hypothetical protein